MGHKPNGFVKRIILHSITRSIILTGKLFSTKMCWIFSSSSFNVLREVIIKVRWCQNGYQANFGGVGGFTSNMSKVFISYILTGLKQALGYRTRPSVSFSNICWCIHRGEIYPFFSFSI